MNHDEWQPIKTAPKDDPILAYGAKRGHLAVVRWACGQWRVRYTNEPAPFEPTHWMPLPAPPVEESEVVAATIAIRKTVWSGIVEGIQEQRREHI